MMKRRYHVLWIILVIIAIALGLSKLICKLEDMAIPEGWEKTKIYITHITTYEGRYAYTLSYQYKDGDVYRSIEHHTIDDSKPQEGQCMLGLYKKNEPGIFELWQAIKYE